MTEKGLKKLIKSYRLSLHGTCNGRFTALRGYKTQIFKQILKTFSLMAINVQGISLIHEQVHYGFVQRFLYYLITVLDPFSVILQSYNLCKVELTYVSNVRMTARKITKIF